MPTGWPIIGGSRPFELGHAGVLIFDPSSGFTKYYEFGRYEDLEGECGGCGAVRSYGVPKLVIGSDDKPTKPSLDRVFQRISQDLLVELACRRSTFQALTSRK
jgi:hypothetical protein